MVEVMGCLSQLDGLELHNVSLDLVGTQETIPEHNQ